MNKKILYPLIGLVLISCITLVFILQMIEKDPTKRGPRVVSSVPDQDGADNDDGLPPQKLYTKAFFFIEESSLMRPVPFEFEASRSSEDTYKTFIRFLLAGREDYISPVPSGAELRALYLVERKGLLIVDFSELTLEDFPGGTTAELEFIYFIVNNICYNFKEVKKVKFLFGGNEHDALSGHLNISDPFYPDFKYIKDE